MDVSSSGGTNNAKRKGHARNLVLAKVLYFSTAMGNVAWNRFQNLYFLEAGILPHQIGQLKALGLALKLIGEPFWCLVADWTEPKLVFVICLLTQLLSMEILRNVVPLTVSIIVYVKLLRTATAPATTLTTMASFKLTEGTHEGFGQQRMFGSLAWGVGSFIVGSLIDNFGMRAMFYHTYFFQTISLFIVARALPGASNISSPPLGLDKKYSHLGEISDIEDGQTNVSIPRVEGATAKLAMLTSTYHVARAKFEQTLSEGKQFLAKRSCNFLLVNAFLTGIIMQVMETYLFVSFAEVMHSTNGFGGLCSFVGSISSAAIFYFSDQLIKKYGHGKCILFAAYMFFLRLAALSVTPYTWTYSKEILAAQHLLTGPSFAIFWATSVDALFKQSPKQLGTTCMATLNMFYFVLGPCVGSLLWGYVYKFCGGMTFTFYVLAMIMQGYTILFCKQRADMLDAAMESKVDAEDDAQGLLMVDIGHSGLKNGSSSPGGHPISALIQSSTVGEQRDYKFAPKTPENSSYSRKPHGQSL